MSDTKNLRKKRERLWRELEGKCENCGCETVLPKGRIPAELQPDNMATIEHKYCRHHPMRRDKPGKERRRFLWCKKCNKEKSKRENIWNMLHIFTKKVLLLSQKTQ